MPDSIPTSLVNRATVSPTSVWQSSLVLLSMCIAVFTMGLMSTAVVDAMVKMRDDLSLTPTTIQWLMNGYFLAAASLVIIAGRLSEIYGRRNVFFLGLLCFIIGLVVTAVSGDGMWVIIGRVIQGVGAAVVAPGTMALLRLKLPPSKQAFAVTTWSAAAGLGFCTGPIIGGALTDGLSWRYLFWLAVILLLISAVLLFASRAKNKPEEGARRIDWWGALLVILFAVPFFLALVQGNSWGWGSPWTWGLLVLGTIFFAVMLVVELSKAEPLVLLRLFSDRLFAMGVLGMIFNGFNLMAILYFVSLYLQLPYSLDFSAIMTGVALLPFSFGFFLASLSASFLTKHLHFRFPLMISGLLQAGGFLWLCFMSPSTTYLFLWAPYLFIGLGLGFIMATFPVLAMMSVADEHANKASGLVNMANYFGATLAPAIGTIFFFTLSTAVFMNILKHISMSGAEMQGVASALFGHGPTIARVLHGLAPHAREEVLVAMKHSALIANLSVMIMCAVVGLIVAVLPLILIPRKRVPDKSTQNA